MPIFTCPDCQNPISTDASACPNCGKNLSNISQEQKAKLVARRSVAGATASVLMILFSSLIILAGLITLLLFWPAGLVLIIIGVFMLFGAL